MSDCIFPNMILTVRFFQSSSNDEFIIICTEISRLVFNAYEFGNNGEACGDATNNEAMNECICAQSSE